MTSGYKHGLSYTKVYRVLMNIKNRVFDPKHPQFEDYGGRGISITEEWLGESGPVNFVNWALSSGYKEGLTIDRIDVNGNYEPSNCRWVTMKEQTRNRRSTKLLTYNGMTMTAKEWSFYIGGSQNLVQARLKKGWPLEKALTPPNKH